MKKFFMFLAAAMIAVACSFPKGYTITGSVAGLTGHVTLILDLDEVASVEATEGEFEFRGNVAYSHLATLQYEEGILAQFIIENSDFTVTGEAGGNIEIAGGELQKVYSETNEKLTAIMLERQDPGISPERMEATAEEIREIYLNTAELQEHRMTREVLESARFLLSAESGNKYINVVQPDPAGNEIDLAEVLKSNKYVLVDFWASWCGPCLEEIPYMVSDYAEYHPKGFEIYGISLDRSKDDWVQAIRELKLDWLHVGYAKYWDNPACRDYAVRAIPSNFLVSSDGIIVARDLRGRALGAKLAELLP